MKKVYISGPMDGQPNYKVEFKLAEAYYRDLGYEVINPVRIAESLDLIHSEQGEAAPHYCDYLLADLAGLSDCHMMVLLKGYRESFGCGFEIAFANRKRIPMYEAFTDKPIKAETKVCIVRVYDTLLGSNKIGETLETIKEGNYVG